MHMSVREIHVSSDSSYFLRVDWEGLDLSSGFQLLLTDGQYAWRGEVSEETLCGEAEELEMNLERYIEDLHQVLTGTESAVTYTFSLTPTPPKCSSTVTLSYEKVQKDIAFSLGSVLLDPIPEPVEAVRGLLIHSLEKGNALECQNKKLQKENQKLRQEQQHITAELKRYSSGKEELEAELYSRFVLILNEKKAKIRSLQKTVTHLQDVGSSDDPKKKGSDQTADQAEEDEYGGSTEEELEEEQAAPAYTKPTRESSTTSPLDDSLSDITDVAPCRKRRFRQPGPPDLAANQSNPQTSMKKRSEPPAAASKQQKPHRATDAAAATSETEDLFEDF